jgi:hypothetical protein
LSWNIISCEYTTEYTCISFSTQARLLSQETSFFPVHDTKRNDSKTENVGKRFMIERTEEDVKGIFRRPLPCLVLQENILQKGWEETTELRRSHTQSIPSSIHDYLIHPFLHHLLGLSFRILLYLIRQRMKLTRQEDSHADDDHHHDHDSIS